MPLLNWPCFSNISSTSLLTVGNEVCQYAALERCLCFHVLPSDTLAREV